MEKSLKVCFINTATNGLHTAYGDVSKKNMYGIARLIMVEYLIGYYQNDKFIEEKKEKYYIKPETINYQKEAQKIHKISMDKAHKKGFSNTHVMKQLSRDLKGVRIVVGHNLKFHLKSLQAECFRTCTYIDFSNFTLVDTGYFNQDKYISIDKLAEKHNIDSNKKLRILKKVFLKEYIEFTK